MPKFVPVTNPELARNEQDQVSGIVRGCPTLRLGRNTLLGMTHGNDGGLRVLGAAGREPLALSTRAFTVKRFIACFPSCAHSDHSYHRHRMRTWPSTARGSPSNMCKRTGERWMVGDTPPCGLCPRIGYFEVGEMEAPDDQSFLFPHDFLRSSQ